MRTFALTFAKFLALIPAVVLAGSVVPGEVVLDHYECKTYDHIVIETPRGYTTAQVYRGYSSTHSGVVIYGEFHSYGFEDIYDAAGSNVGRIWIDDYMANSEVAQEWCYEE